MKKIILSIMIISILIVMVGCKGKVADLDQKPPAPTSDTDIPPVPTPDTKGTPAAETGNSDVDDITKSVSEIDGDNADLNSDELNEIESGIDEIDW